MLSIISCSFSTPGALLSLKWILKSPVINISQCVITTSLRYTDSSSLNDVSGGRYMTITRTGLEVLVEVISMCLFIVKRLEGAFVN